MQFFFLLTLFQYGLTIAPIQNSGLINAKYNNVQMKNKFIIIRSPSDETKLNFRMPFSSSQGTEAYLEPS